MKKKLLENKLLVIGIGLSILFFAAFAIFNNQIFIFEGDVLNQNVKMTLQAWDKFHNGESFLWNWSNFLGASYIGTATYYGFGSIFFWLTIFVPFKTWVIPMFLYTNVFKAVICTVGGYLWIEKSTRSKEGAFASSLIISFSGFVLTNYNNNVMFDAICFMPLCLYFTECFLQDNHRKTAISLIIGLIGITNYYFLYLFLPFLCFYALFRYLMLYRFNFKQCLITALEFLLYVFLGVGVSAILLVPSFYALMNNPRSSKLPDLFDVISKFDIYRFITSFLNPVNDWRINNNYYVNTSVYEGIGYSGGMAVYSFMIFPFLFPLLFFVKNKKDKYTLLSFYGLYGIFVLFKVFYVLFNQNLESRWMMNLIFLNAFLVGYVIAHRNEIKKGLYFLSFVAVIGLIVVCLFTTHHFYLSPDIWGWKIIVRNAIIGGFILLGYAITFGIVKADKGFKAGLIVCVATELAFSYWNVFNNDGYNLDPMTKEELEQYQLYENEIINRIQEDKEFYRIDQMTLHTLHENDSYVYNYHSFNGYTSIYNYNQIPFIDGRFKVSYAWNFYPQPGKWLLKSRLGGKYFICYSDQDQIPFGYDYLFNENNISVYQNQYALPFAYAKEGVISINELDQYSVLMQDRLLINNIATNETDAQTNYSMLDNLTLVYEQGTGSFQIDVETYSSGYLYVEFMEHTSVSYEVYDENNEMIDYNYLIRDLNYAAIPLPKEAVRVGITVLQPVNVYFDSMEWYEEWYEKTINNSVYNISWNDKAISGKIVLDSNQMIFTSVPYDKGWKLTVDGESQSYLMVDNGFVGFELNAGEHEIKLEFFPVGLRLGSIITIFSLILIVGMSLIKKESVCKHIK